MSALANVYSLDQKRADYVGNPQVEDGYTRIANELFDAILSFGFSGRQLHVVLAIIRKTYGFGKTEDQIGIRQFEKITGIRRDKVAEVIRELAEMSVLNVSHEGYCQTVSLNKKYMEWVVPEKGTVETQTVPKKGTKTVPELGFETVPKKGTTKESKQKKERKAPEALPAPDFGGPEVQQAWADFVAHRLETKKPLTPRAAVLNLNVLRKADTDGYCCVALIHKAIANSWRGIFDPKPGDKRKAQGKAERKVAL